METITTPPKRGRGRPRLHTATRIVRHAQHEEDALCAKIAAADAVAASQHPVELLLVTTKQVAEALQVSDRIVTTLIAEGHLPSVRILGSRRVFLDDLRKFAAKGTHE